MGVNDFEHIKVLFHLLNLLLIIIVVVFMSQLTVIVSMILLVTDSYETLHVYLI